MDEERKLGIEFRLESGLRRTSREQGNTLDQHTHTSTKLKAFVRGSLSSWMSSASRSSASTLPTRVMRGSGGGAEAMSARILEMSCWALCQAFCQEASRASG